MTESEGTGPDGSSDGHSATLPSGGADTLASDPLATSPVGTAGAPVDIRPGGRLGAFVVDSVLGSGAMGIVVKAVDPELNRPVAIKLLAGRHGDPAAGRRLLREAQSAAQLSHPNVVAVHQVGTIDDQVYVVMEFVEQTLRQWLAAAPRSWREVLAAYTQAGRGLAAAHAAGLVHRDFKPDNALVGSNNRVRVSDFGLVAAASAGTTLIPPSWSGAEDAIVDDRLTRTGAVLGTPAYMAPEQYRGSRVDARADQFALCVALFEALYGARPFEGATIPNLFLSINEGRVRPVTPGRVPDRIHRALVRGLSVDPDDRFASIEALLDELNRPEAPRGPGRTTVALAIAGAAVLVGGVVGVGALVLRSTDAVGPDGSKLAACEDLDDELSGVWDPSVRERMSRAFAGSGGEVPRLWFESVAGRLEERAQAWVELRREYCEAGPSDDALASCLDERREELAALTEMLTSEEAGTVVGGALAAVDELGSVAPCRNAAQLAAAPAMPLKPELRQARTELWRTRARVRVLMAADRHAEAEAALRPFADRLRELGDEVGLAEVLVLRSEALSNVGEQAPAEAVAVEAIQLAAQANAPAIEAAARTVRLGILGYGLGRADQAIAELEVTRAAVARAHDERLAAGFHATVGLVLTRAGRFVEGEAELARAIAMFESHPDRHYAARGSAHGNRASTLRQLGRPDDAAAEYERAIELMRDGLGPDNAYLGATILNYGHLLLSEGDLDRAAPMYAEARDMFERVHGAGDVSVAPVYLGLGELEQARGNGAGARDYFERVLKAYRAQLGDDDVQVGLVMVRIGMLEHSLGRFKVALEKLTRAKDLIAAQLGADHVEVGNVTLQLAMVADARGDLDASVLHLERVLDSYRRTYGPKHQLVAVIMASLGDAHQQAGRCQQAQEHYRAALSLRSELGKTADGDLAQILAGVGLCELSSGKRSAAAESLEQALDLTRRFEVVPQLRARVLFANAQLQPDQVESMTLARQAAELFSGAGQPYTRYRTEVERWVAAHGG